MVQFVLQTESQEAHPVTKRMKPALKRDAVLNLRVPKEIKVALRQAAVADDRSISGMAVRLLREQLEARGFLGKE